jgi:hypothetical protein
MEGIDGLGSRRPRGGAATPALSDAAAESGDAS